MRNTRKWIRFFLLISVGLAAGCANRTIDDYNRDKVLQELRKYEQIRGIYRGTIVSSQSRQSLGEFAVKLWGEEGIGESSDKLTQTHRALLRGQASYTGNTASTMFVFDNAFYDDVTRNVRATFKIPRAGLESMQVELSGTVDGTHLGGRVSAAGYPEDGALISLTRDSTASETQPISSPGRGRVPGKDPVPPPTGVDQQAFAAAELKTYDQSKKSATLVLTSRSLTTEERVVDLLVPVRTVDMMVHVFSNGDLIFDHFVPGAILDRRTGNLHGRVTLDVDCNEAALKEGGIGWYCIFKGPHGFLYEGTFVPQMDTPVPPPLPNPIPDPIHLP